MIIVMFELNGKIELISMDDNITYGLIHDFTGEKLYASITSDDKQIKLLHVGDNVRCIIFNKLTGTTFEAVITDRISGEFPIYELSELHDFTEIQRRQDVRVSCTIPVFYSKNDYLMKQDIEIIYEEFDKIKKYLINGMMTDLSAGGLKFSCEDRFSKNQTLLFLIQIDKEDMFIKGNVLHKAINISPKRTLYTYGIQFIDINEQQREKIIKFLFVLMRKNRLK